GSCEHVNVLPDDAGADIRRAKSLRCPRTRQRRSATFANFVGRKIHETALEAFRVTHLISIPRAGIEFDLCPRFSIETSYQTNRRTEELPNEQANPRNGFVRSGA